MRRQAGPWAACDPKPDKARVGGDGGIRTLDRALQPYNGLANRRLQPLGHISGFNAYARHVGTPQALVNMGCPAVGQLFGRGRLKFDATGRLPALPDRSCSGLWTNPSCGLAASGDNKRPLGDRLRRSMRRLPRRPNKAAPPGISSAPAQSSARRRLADCGPPKMPGTDIEDRLLINRSMTCATPKLRCGPVRRVTMAILLVVATSAVLHAQSPAPPPVQKS